MGAEGKQAVDEGGAIVEVVLTEDDAALAGWVNAYDLQVTTVLPLDGKTEEELGGREWAYIVDLEDQTIVWKAFGSYGSTDNSSAKQGIEELRSRL